MAGRLSPRDEQTSPEIRPRGARWRQELEPADSDAGKATEESQPRSSTVQAAARTVRILGVLVRRPQGMRLGELSEELDLKKATVRRLLRTLIAERVVQQDSPGGSYRFSPVVWLEFAPFIAGAQSVSSEARRVLQRLAEVTGATAMILLPDELGRRMAATLYHVAPTPIRLDPGSTTAIPAPMHATAAGKCYLAHLNEDELNAYIAEGLPAVTEHTITAPERFLEELATVRDRGFAENRSEALVGCPGVSVPLRDGGGQVVGGLSLAAAGRELTEGEVQRWVALLRAAADRLSKVLHAVTAESAPRPPSPDRLSARR